VRAFPLRAVLLLLLALAPAAGQAGEAEVTGRLGVEGQLFTEPPVYAGQRRHSGSAVGELEFYGEWDSGALTVKPFYRYDSADFERTHFDLREASLLLLGEDWANEPWELRLGLDKVFWGVTESVHLVDIVNQTDLVEALDGEDKLGQPMIFLSAPREFGVFDLFVLPYFRERTFPGKRGRLRFSLPIDDALSRYESGAKRQHVDFAARYSHTLDVLDFGFSYFHGTSRDPGFIPVRNRDLDLVLAPFYPVIDQGSVDAQVTTGPWLLKLEALYRAGQTDRTGRPADYLASAAGFEYTFFEIFETPADLGLLAEWLYDSRSGNALSDFEDDLFLAFRLAANDTQDSQLLAGVIQDLSSESQSFRVEASRRIGDSFTLNLEGSFFVAPQANDFLAALADDDFIQLELDYHFGL
jgi:hypothetical protein